MAHYGYEELHHIGGAALRHLRRHGWSAEVEALALTAIREKQRRWMLAVRRRHAARRLSARRLP